MWTTAIKFFTIITACLSGSAVCMQITIPYPQINVTAGGNVTLYCTYASSVAIGKGLGIDWSFHEHYSQTSKAVYYLDAGTSSGVGNFVNRVTAATNPGNATITISNMQPRDTGTYYVTIMNPPDVTANAGQIQLTVLVAPSTPHCSIKGAVETGHHLSLKCYSETGMPRPTYYWNKVTDGVLSPTPPGMNYDTGMLIIGNLTKFETGHYRCTASNFLGNATCEIDLNTGGAEGIIAAAIIAALLAAVIIFAIIWIIVIKGKKKEKLAGTEMKPMMQANQETVPAQAAPTSQSLLAAPLDQANEYSNAHAEHVYTASSNEEMEGENTPAVA
ncbi:V-set and immunoglobulin domain-containing protein 1 [Pleurodeles waltl]|uniref:V-set and immunoglobulin domain-containing protein 1 n=1 Tax=Pleurodeles waltl TaxID=8319 RepID=UPI00370953ED